MAPRTVFRFGPAGSNLPVDANHSYHTGDIPNLIVSSEGRGFPISRFQPDYTLARFTFDFDADGSAVIVHLNPDRGEPGVTGASGGAHCLWRSNLSPMNDDDFNIER